MGQRLDLPRILEDARIVAIVGCSPRAVRTSHRIARYLVQVGYRIIPVNPYHDSILGEACYASVDAIPTDIRLDIVNVFRRPAFTADVVRDVMMRRKVTGHTPVVWTQLGVSSREAALLAEEERIPFVANRCILVEHGNTLPLL